uniref:Uncharacterized protein n=1 Tax=Moniliophthora roreri TaxID=221103 RepID=A0A0W0FXM9_MONRR
MTQLHDRLPEALRGHLGLDIDDILRRIDDHDARIQELECTLATRDARIQELETKLQEVKDDIALKENEAEDLLVLKYEAMDHVDELESEIERLEAFEKLVNENIALFMRNGILNGNDLDPVADLGWSHSRFVCARVWVTLCLALFFVPITSLYTYPMNPTVVHVLPTTSYLVMDLFGVGGVFGLSRGGIGTYHAT